MRPQILFPLACAITSFILGLFCILAGSSPGYMEDYHIIALNTSTLGYNLVNASKTASSSGSSPTSIGSWFTGILQNVTSAIESDLTAIEYDLVNKLAAELGIKQWYSLHIMDMCEGYFSPNATAPAASYNVSSCTNRTAMYHFDPSTQINNELNDGKFHLNISQIQWPQDVTNGLQALNTALDATFISYVIGIAATGLDIIFSLVAVFLPPSYSPSSHLHHYHSRAVNFVSVTLALLGFLALGIASVIVTVLMVKATNLINQYGNEIGLYAEQGSKYLAITWAATAVMLLAILSWVGVCCLSLRSGRREWAEKSTRRRLSA